MQCQFHVSRRMNNIQLWERILCNVFYGEPWIKVTFRIKPLKCMCIRMHHSQLHAINVTVSMLLHIWLVFFNSLLQLQELKNIKQRKAFRDSSDKLVRKNVGPEPLLVQHVLLLFLDQGVLDRTACIKRWPVTVDWTSNSWYLLITNTHTLTHKRARTIYRTSWTKLQFNSIQYIDGVPCAKRIVCYWSAK